MTATFFILILFLSQNCRLKIAVHKLSFTYYNWSGGIRATEFLMLLKNPKCFLKIVGTALALQGVVQTYGKPFTEGSAVWLAPAVGVDTNRTLRREQAPALPIVDHSLHY